MSVELSYEIHKGGGSVAAVGREKKKTGVKVGQNLEAQHWVLLKTRDLTVNAWNVKR